LAQGTSAHLLGEFLRLNRGFIVVTMIAEGGTLNAQGDAFAYQESNEE
jgi:hypothetical protein